MKEFQIKLDHLSDEQLEVFASLASLNISFENKALFIDLQVDKNSKDARIGAIQDRIQLMANNGKQIKVVHADGSPSMVLATDQEGKPIQQVVEASQPIYREMLGEDGEPLQDEDGNLMVDSEGKPIQELIGYTLPVLEEVYVQETIGEFDFWQLRYKELVEELLQAIVRNLGGESEQVVMVKSEA